MSNIITVFFITVHIAPFLFIRSGHSLASFLFAVAFILCSAVSYSAEIKNITGKVTKVQLMGKSYQQYSTAGEAIAFIYVDALPAACGSVEDYKRVAITSNHPAFNIVFSGALAAKAKGDDVRMHYVEECTQWNGNAWDFSIMTIL